jgi:hypothetical protein
MAKADGLTRITGRMWGLLVVSGKAVAPAQIADARPILLPQALLRRPRSAA